MEHARGVSLLMILIDGGLLKQPADATHTNFTSRGRRLVLIPNVELTAVPTKTMVMEKELAIGATLGTIHESSGQMRQNSDANIHLKWSMTMTIVILMIVMLTMMTMTTLVTLIHTTKQTWTYTITTDRFMLIHLPSNSVRSLRMRLMPGRLT